MLQSFSYERLANTRRIRKVKRLFKQVPLFAFAFVETELPGYTYKQFLTDLKPKKTKSKIKRTKSPLQRYGRFNQIKKLLELYQQTGDVSYGLKAIQLRKIITKPYRILIKKHGRSREFCLSPLIPYNTITELVQEMSACNTLEQVEEHFFAFKKYAHIL